VEGAQPAVRDAQIVNKEGEPIPGVPRRAVESLPVNRRILVALSYGHLATDLSQGAVPALLPVFQSRYHLSYLALGLVVLIANVSSSVIQPAFGMLSDRIKLHWLMPAGALVAGVGIALAVLARHYAMMVGMIFFSGLGVAAFHPEGYKSASLASGERRATGMSYFSAGGNLGYGLGPAAASVAISLWGEYGICYIIPFAIAAALVLWRTVSPWAASARADIADIAAATPAGRRAQRVPAASSGAGAGGILALLVTYVILRSWISTNTSSYIPLYFTGVRHMAPTYGGVVVSVFLGSGAIGTLLGGIAADRWGHRRMLVLSMLILPPFLWAIPRLAGAWPLLAALISGMAVVSTFAVAMVMAQALFPQRVGLVSGLIIGFAVGMGGVGVTALGGIADRWGVLRAMDVTTLLPFAAAAVALLLPGESPSGRNPLARPPRTSISDAPARAGGH